MKIWNLDPYIDVDLLENLHLKICQGIALSNRDLATRVIPHYEMQGNLNLAIDFKNSDSNRISAVADHAEDILTNEEKEIYRSLDYNQKRTFLELYKNAYNDGEYVRIRFTKKEYLLDTFSTFYSSTTDWTENTKYFKDLIDWIYLLPFIDIGRILIFVTKHYMHGDLHYDRRDEWLNGKHHFIWLNPFNQKKFCLYDGYTEIPITSKSAFFDTRYIHGSKIHDKSVYSIRIDGQLTEQFCKQADIPWTSR
jgi:hypothetical protein